MERFRPNTKEFQPRNMYWLFYRRWWHFFVFAPSTMTGTVYIFANFVTGKMLDSYGNPNAKSLVGWYALALVGYALLVAVCAWISHIMWIRIGTGIGVKIRQMLFKGFLQGSVTFYDQSEVGHLLQLLNADAKTVESAFTNAKSQQCRFFGQFISSLILSFSVSIPLAIVNFLTVLFSGEVVSLMRQLGVAHMDSRAGCLGRATTIASEAISNIRVVFSFNRQRHELERYDEEMKAAANHEGWNRLWNGLAFALSFVINWGTVGLILDVGATLVFRQKMSAGGLFSMSRACFVGGMGLRNLFATWHNESLALHAWRRIQDSLAKSTNEICLRGDPVAPPFEWSGRVEFRDVSFRYPTRPLVPVLTHVNLVIESGKISACVGHSGSGKSTIVQLILRFYDPDEGQILFDDTDIQCLDPRWIHRAVGVVQQDPILFCGTIERNISYGTTTLVRREAIERAAEAAYCSEFIERLGGFEYEITEKGGNLSGGQRQRVAIARAILGSPTLLITDEATSALDVVSEREVQRALDHALQGRTSLCIAHRLATIRNAHVIFVFDHGEVVEQGSHQELLDAGGAYANLLSRQLVGSRDNLRTESKESLSELL